MTTEEAAPGVAAIAGRRIDVRGTSERRFPLESAAVVHAGVKRLLIANRIGRVVTSAACGADIVALEAALELGLQVRIVLPFEANRFRASSVVDRGEAWGQRFDALLEHPAIRPNVLVVSAEAPADDAAYAEATRRILAEAQALVTNESKPICLAIWDGQVRDGVDATNDFITQANAKDMPVLSLSTLPLSIAEEFIEGGDQEPEPMLELWSDLMHCEPVLATRLARALAMRFLEGKQPMRTKAVDGIWKACKEVEAFGLARRMLGRRLDRWGQIIAQAYDREPSDAKLQQQRALCTSKDPDLSAAMRHDWALRILRPEQTPLDCETQGIAGGIWKRRWEWDGSRASLERSLEHYRAGKPDDPNQDCGYCAINCAFVMDLLASLIGDHATAAQYRSQADTIRQELIEKLLGANLWADATLAEAYLGLGRLDAAKAAMKSYMSRGPASWEVETSLRQLVRLAYVRGIAEVSRVLEVPFGTGNAATREAALTSLLVGRVGLALSGGGFRAALYHLGVLARLAESDVLRHVEVMSCVSGGSIVGAHYYLCLREELEANGEALTRGDYVRIVRRVIDEFVRGVAHNVRTRVLADWSNAYAITSGNNRAYAEAVSKTVHDTFYEQLVSETKPLHELLVQPKEAPHNFHPGRHNWTRRNKVPMLVLNAATLNTGHSWQFTARSMGESPFGMQPEVDSNSRLRRPNYRHGIHDRTVRLRDAVAASACVPGLFAPLQLDRLYPGYQVRLVDGGVFDNQGAASLVEQDCQVLLISDAAGQLFTELEVDGGHVAPLLRSVGIFQERMRQIGYEALFKRKEAGQLRGLAYTHLTQGLKAEVVDWDKCEDPRQANDQLPDDIGNLAGTGAGVDGEIQLYLARMRTDLDVFSEIECAALMASGYKAMGAQLDRLFLQVPALVSVRQVEKDWFFSRLLPIVGGQDHDPAAYGVLRKHLEVSSSKLGRSVSLNPRLRLLCGALAALVAGAVLAAIWALRECVLFTVGGAAVLLAGILIRVVVGDWAGLLLDPRKALRVPMQNALGALLLTLFAKVVLKWVDPDYLRCGRLDRLFDTKVAAKRDLQDSV